MKENFQIYLDDGVSRVRKEENMKKYLSFVIPCYNSQDYMRRCVDSLLAGGDEVEIIIVNDGSTDATGQIAGEYAERFPGIVRAVHKENGGHGSGVNAGLALARGTYFKVVDSDDWLDDDAYMELLSEIRRYCGRGEADGNENGIFNGLGIQEEFTFNGAGIPDMIVCNYVYNHLYEGTARSMSYQNVFPEGRLFGWDEIGHFRPSQYLVMHALIFRTELLRKAGVKLPEHTFYVDNLFACQPLPYVKRIRYMNIDLYQYFLGREDQSVNEKVLISRIDQQIKVTKLVSECVDLETVKQEHPKLALYLCRNISVMLAISSIHLLLIGTEEAYRKREELWQEIRQMNPMLYYRLRFGTLSGFTYLPGKLGGLLTIGGYRAAKRIYQFQ